LALSLLVDVELVLDLVAHRLLLVTTGNVGGIVIRGGRRLGGLAVDALCLEKT